MKPLVLGLGNDILGDDGAGIHAVRRLAAETGLRADLRESSLHGLALMELLIGYRQAIIIDAIQTGHYPPGTVLEIDPAYLRPVPIPSPHYAGLPEMIDLARQMGIDFPRDIRVIAIEIESSPDIGEALSAPVSRAIPRAARWAQEIVQGWERRETARACTKNP